MIDFAPQSVIDRRRNRDRMGPEYAGGTLWPPQQVALRCRIVLACSGGLSDVAIAKQLSINRKTVILWRKRFAQQRLDGVWEIAPSRGRKPRYDIDKIAAIVDATLYTKSQAMTHWSCRTMAKSQEVSKSTIHNIWQAHNLKPHRVKTFKPGFPIWLL